jgi:ring-1,2-phenylacetyl-CoA epoxidase subunit PaaE
MAGFVPLRITRIIQETPESSTFVLDPVNGSQILYKAGQFLTLIFQIPGGEIRRS